MPRFANLIVSRFSKSNPSSKHPSLSRHLELTTRVVGASRNVYEGRSLAEDEDVSARPKSAYIALDDDHWKGLGSQDGRGLGRKMADVEVSRRDMLSCEAKAQSML